MTKSSDVPQHFPQATEFDWQDLLAQSIKNLSLEKNLLKETYEGVQLKGLYHPENQNQYHGVIGYPGAYPFLRGTDTIGQSVDGVGVIGRYDHPNAKTSNQRIKEDWNEGLDMALLVLDRKGKNGIHLQDEKTLDLVFNDLSLDEKKWGFYCEENILLGSTFFAQYFNKKQNLSDCYFFNDPFNRWLEMGELPFSPERVLSHLTESSLVLQDSFLNSRNVLVSGSVVHHGGSDRVTELSYMLSTGVAYLEALMKGGMKLKEATNQIFFQMVFDSHLFASVAKVRAFRFLWARVIELWGGKKEQLKPCIIGKSSLKEYTLYDRDNNLLRGTLHTLGSYMGGVSFFETARADEILRYHFKNKGQDKELYRRYARNTQLILNNESHISKSIDPMGGSWYLEELTQKFCEKAWVEFQQIQSQGGVIPYIKEGKLASKVKAVREKRIANIKKRRKVITGVNQFSNPSEKIKTHWKEKVYESFHVEEKDCPPELLKEIVNASNDYKSFEFGKKSLGKALTHAYQEGVGFEKVALTLHSLTEEQESMAIPFWREGEIFERLRLKLEDIDNRFKVIVLIFGDYSTLSARSLFCQDIFETLGITTEEKLIDNKEELMSFDLTQFNAIVLCSDEDGYKDVASDFIKNSFSKKKPCYLAGRLEEKFESSLKKDGLTSTLYKGRDIYEVLSKLLESWGINE